MADNSTQEFSDALKTAPDMQQPFGVTQIHPVEMMAKLLRDKAVQTATLPQRAIENSQYALDTGVYDPAVPVEAATSLGRGGMAVAKPGTAGIFGGKLAKGANHGGLAIAQDMAAHGELPAEVRAGTGWSRSPADWQWRFEIPDNGSALTYMPQSMGDKAISSAGALFRHNRLYEQYPELQNINTSIVRAPQASGYFDHNTNSIHAQGPNMADARSVMLHELQHAVQSKEGFSPGLNPGFFAQQIEQDMRAQPGGARNFNYNDIQNLAHQKYQQIAGEVEARNVQHRRDFSPQQRQVVHPWESQDIPYMDQTHYNPVTGTVTALRDKRT